MQPINLTLLIFILTLSGGLAYGMAQVKQNEDSLDLMKCQGMDPNSDGVITREEWQRTFNNHDWNNDGVLSGDEVRLGASRYQGADQFRQMDRNNDGMIYRNEWTGTADDFNRLDQDRNGNLSVNEFYQRTGPDQFSQFDYNNDAVIKYDEWYPNSRRSFEVLDLNRDGRLTRDEFYNPQQYSVSVFRELDQNNDRMISRSEWRSTSDSFNRLDTNGDNILSESEFNTPQSSSVAVQIIQEILKKR
jgi:Ca2+-binding EF-hand superfamily protein